VHLVDARLRRLESNEIVGSLEDVTVRHNLETERLRTQRLESIGRLAGGLAHDFNNLLTVILGNISLARHRLGAQDLELTELDLSVRACEQAANLAKQMLAFSKGGDPKRESSDLGELVREGVELYTRGSNIKVELSVEDGLHPVHIDTSQINQVLNNLIVNGIESMPSGGRLRVDVEGCSFSESPDGVPVRGVSVSIRDEGEGIPPDHLEHIFEPYFTTKESGNGLGLTSAYWITKRHDGILEVESARGVGTLFRLVLPLATEVVADAISARLSSVEKRAGRILLMDDDDLVRGAMMAMTQSLGHEVTGVADGEACLDAYKKASDRGAPYDLVILDLTIVGGHDGLWTVSQLKAFDPDVKAVVASGYSNAPVVSDHARYGFVGVLPKPMTLEELDDLIGSLLPVDVPSPE
jgi:nitrogen-specific signal transduction histidine kinase/ActR/RegA family two-component response regulator